jgi:hypothetical protein
MYFCACYSVRHRFYFPKQHGQVCLCHENENIFAET